MVHLTSSFAFAVSCILYAEAMPHGMAVRSVIRARNLKGQSKALSNALPVLEQLLRRETVDNATSANDWLEMLTTPTSEASSATSSPASFASSNVVGMQVVTPGSTLFVNDTTGALESTTVYVASESIAPQQPSQTVLSFYSWPTTTTIDPTDFTSAVNSENEVDAMNNPVISNDILDNLAGLTNLMPSSDGAATATPTAVSLADTFASNLPLVASTVPDLSEAVSPVVSALQAAVSDIPTANAASNLAYYLQTGIDPAVGTTSGSQAVSSESGSLAPPEEALLRSIVQAIQASQQLNALDDSQKTATTVSKTNTLDTNAATPARKVQAARANRARASMLAQVKAARLAQKASGSSTSGTGDLKNVTETLPGNFISTAIDFVKDKLQIKRSPNIISDAIGNFTSLLKGGQSSDDLSYSGTSVRPQLSTLAADPDLSTTLVNEVADLMAENNAAAIALNGQSATYNDVSAPASAMSSLTSMLSPLTSAASTASDTLTDAADSAYNVLSDRTDTGTAAGGGTMSRLVSAIPSAISGITSMMKNTTLGKMLTS